MSRDDGLTRTPDGDLVPEVDERPAVGHPPTCEAGWLGFNLDGALVACPVCRAATIRRLEQQQQRWSK